MYRLTVVVKTPDGHIDRHVDFGEDVDLELAEQYRDEIRKRGFMSEGERYFPDQIESLQVYKKESE